MSLLPRMYFATPDAPGGTPTSGTPSTSMDKDDIIDFLGSDDDGSPGDSDSEDTSSRKKGSDTTREKTTEEEIAVVDDDEEDDKDEDEDKPLELDEEPPTDEQLELMTPARRRDILKKYPNLFKDFPYLQTAYYREQQFTELLPTIEDAKEAVSKAQSWDKFTTEVLSGTTENVLYAVKQENPEGFAKLVDEYLPTLARVDEKAYYHVLGNVSKHTIIAMLTEAKRSNNPVLQNAAQILNQFVFGSSEFSPPTQLSQAPKESSKEIELSRREQDFVYRQFSTANEDLNQRVNNTLKNTLETHIDPRRSMTEYVRKNAVREAGESLATLIDSDKRFKSLIDKLWENSFRSNFNKASLDEIKSAYVSKAKTLLPSVIKKARNDALRGMGKRVRDDDASTEASNNERPRSQVKSSGKIKSSADIPRGMRTIDFLNQD